VEPWWYTIRYFGEALPEGVATTFLFLVSLWARMASSVIMMLLTNSENVPLVLSFVRHILRQMVELLGVVVHRSSSLLEVHELLTLLPHHACGDVVGVESITEFSP
jgi:hypothetical protein